MMGMICSLYSNEMFMLSEILLLPEGANGLRKLIRELETTSSLGDEDKQAVAEEMAKVVRIAWSSVRKVRSS